MLEKNGDYRNLGSIVQDRDAGKRLDFYLAESFPFLSRNGWQKKIAESTVVLNGRAAKASNVVKYGDVIQMYHPLTAEPPVDETLELVWQKGAVMVVAKGAPLPMHENGAYRKKTLYHLLGEKFGKEWAAVHRLDRETSGLVVCAAGVDVRRSLSNQFIEHKVYKEYLALANGIPNSDLWTCDAPIGDAKGSQIRIKKWIDFEDGLSAKTDFKKLYDVGKNHSVLKAFPKTGRTNQIRIHAAFSGYELLGDKLYHRNEEVFLRYYEQGNTEFVQNMAGFHRHCLHASVIEFTHPEIGKRVDAFSELPEDIRRKISELQRADREQEVDGEKQDGVESFGENFSSILSNSRVHRDRAVFSCP